MIIKMPIAIKQEQGVVKTKKKNVLIVSDGTIEKNYTSFDTISEMDAFVRERNMVSFEEIAVKTEEGMIDETATKEVIESNYVSHYLHLQTIAIPFESGLSLKANQAKPIEYNGTLYEVLQHHISQADWTPDITPALFSEIQVPEDSGYPEWVQKYSTDVYRIGDIVTYDGSTWVCTQGDANGYNSWEPGVFGWEIVE